MDITGNGCKRKPVKMQIRFRCVRLKCCGSLERSVKRGCSFIVQKNEITRFSMFLFESLSKPTRKKPSFLKSHINRSLQHFHISFRLTQLQVQCLKKMAVLDEISCTNSEKTTDNLENSFRIRFCLQHGTITAIIMQAARFILRFL